MAYFPFYMDLENKNVLVVGGGKVALHKVKKLLGFTKRITVVSPKICDELADLNIELVYRKFADTDINGMFCVINAVGDEVLGKHIYSLCIKNGIHLNTVDDKEKCTFIFPAIAEKNGITIGISTSGKSPLLARFIRKKAESLLDEISPETVEIMWKYRPLIKAEIKDESDRKKAFEKLMMMCISGSIPTEAEVKKIAEEFKHDKN